MTPETKKKVIVVGSLLVIAGVVGYILYQRKKTKELALTTPNNETKDVSVDTPKEVVVKTTNPITQQVVVPPTAQGVQTGVVTARLVSATDLLAGNSNGANNKAIFSQISGLPIYNAQRKFVRKTQKKNEYLGVVTSTEKVGGVTMFNFIAGDTIRYIVPISSVLVKVN